MKQHRALYNKYRPQTFPKQPRIALDIFLASGKEYHFDVPAVYEPELRQAEREIMR